MFPRCGIPDAYDGWQGFEDYVSFLYKTGSITEHTQLWWSVRPHLAYPTVEIRICDAQPDLAESQSLAALSYALAARLARAHDEGEPLPDLPHRLLEENMWRAIRYGLSGELIDFDLGEPVPARARLERLLEWVAPVADEIGAAPFLALPAANAAERQRARWQEGASLEQIYAEQVRQVSALAEDDMHPAEPSRPRRSRRRAGAARRSEPSEPEPEPSRRRPASRNRAPSRDREPSLDDIAAQIRAIPIGSFLALDRLDARLDRLRQARGRQLDEARGAIDAIAALLPRSRGPGRARAQARLRPGAHESPARLCRRLTASVLSL